MTFFLDLQLHLEESFFHNHPASMKRTVEFVADRVSSNYIKKFRAGHLPKLVQEGSAKVKDVIQMLAGGFDTRSKVGVLFKHFFMLLNGIFTHLTQTNPFSHVPKARPKRNSVSGVAAG